MELTQGTSDVMNQIRNQIRSLPLEQQVKFLADLGLQIEVTKEETKTELINKTTESFNTAVENLGRPILSRVSDPFSLVAQSSERTVKELKTAIINAIGWTDVSLVLISESAVKSLHNCLDVFYKQIAQIEEHPKRLNVELLNLYSAAYLVAAKSEKLDSIKKQAARAALKGIFALPKPEDVEDDSDFYKVNKSRFVNAQVLARLLKKAPQTDLDKLAELLMHVQPQGYFERKGVACIGIKLCHIKNGLSARKFTNAVAKALESFPTYSLKVAIQDLDEDRLLYFARVAVSGENLDQQKKYLPKEHQERFLYYVETLQAYRKAESVIERCHKNGGIVELGHSALEFKVAGYRLDSIDLGNLSVETVECLEPNNVKILIGATAWDALLSDKTLFTKHAQAVNSEIFRQLAGEPLDDITNKLLRLSETDVKKLVTRLQKGANLDVWDRVYDATTAQHCVGSSEREKIKSVREAIYEPRRIAHARAEETKTIAQLATLFKKEKTQESSD